MPQVSGAVRGRAPAKKLELDEQLRHPERAFAIRHHATASAEGGTIELPTSGRVREDTTEQADEDLSCFFLGS
jgi:hypothetical protein